MDGRKVYFTISFPIQDLHTSYKLLLRADRQLAQWPNHQLGADISHELGLLAQLPASLLLTRMLQGCGDGSNDWVLAAPMRDPNKVPRS